MALPTFCLANYAVSPYTEVRIRNLCTKAFAATTPEDIELPTTTHRVQEHELLRRLELLCETAGLEFPKDAWPKDDHKAYFLLGVCVTEDMKDLSLPERLERLDDWARQRNLLKPNETLFARKGAKFEGKPSIELAAQSVAGSSVG
jgi:hypothetical protein